jgi:hypothetical protein
MNIYNPKVVLQGARSNPYSVQVNFFIGSEKDMIEYRIDHSEWKKMNRIVQYDPYFIYLSQRWDFSDQLLQGSRPGYPNLCAHLWTGNIDTRLDPGEHKIEVRATDLFGRIHESSSTYRIEKSN